MDVQRSGEPTGVRSDADDDDELEDDDDVECLRESDGAEVTDLDVANAGAAWKTADTGRTGRGLGVDADECAGASRADIVGGFCRTAG